MISAGLQSHPLSHFLNLVLTVPSFAYAFLFVGHFAPRFLFHYNHLVELFHLTRLLEQQERTSVRYHEFIRKASLSAGLYALPAGARDPQQPHGEDELYYVLSGRGAIQVGDEDAPVEPGAIIFVAAGVVHRFHSIREDLTLLVFFAPAESSQKLRS